MSYRDDLQAAVERAENAEREIKKMRENKTEKPKVKVKTPRKPWRWPGWLDAEIVIPVTIMIVIISFITWFLISSTQYQKEQAQQRVLNIPFVEKMARNWAGDLGYKVVKVRCDIDRNCALHVENLAAPVSLHCNEAECAIR